MSSLKTSSLFSGMQIWRGKEDLVNFVSWSDVRRIRSECSNSQLISTHYCSIDNTLASVRKGFEICHQPPCPSLHLKPLTSLHVLTQAFHLYLCTGCGQTLVTGTGLHSVHFWCTVGRRFHLDILFSFGGLFSFGCLQCCMWWYAGDCMWYPLAVPVAKYLWMLMTVA